MARLFLEVAEGVLGKFPEIIDKFPEKSRQNYKNIVGRNFM